MSDRPETTVEKYVTTADGKMRVEGPEPMSLAPAIGSAEMPITGLQVLLHCELWTQADMNLVDDKRAFQHRLNVIRQGIKQLEAKDFTCFRCNDGRTPLYCLNCADEIRSRQNAETEPQGRPL